MKLTTITLRGGSRETRTHESFPVTIGEHYGSDIRVRDLGVAEHHATIEVTDLGPVLRCIPRDATVEIGDFQVRKAGLRSGDRIIVSHSCSVLVLFPEAVLPGCAALTGLREEPAARVPDEPILAKYTSLGLEFGASLHAIKSASKNLRSRGRATTGSRIAWSDLRSGDDSQQDDPVERVLSVDSSSLQPWSPSGHSALSSFARVLFAPSELNGLFASCFDRGNDASQSGWDRTHRHLREQAMKGED